MKGFKTILVNGALAIVPVVDYLANNGELVNAVMQNHGAAAVSVIGLVNFVLRWITNTPVLKSEA